MNLGKEKKMKNSSYLSWAAAPLLAQLVKPAWPARALARAPARAPASHLRVPAAESHRRVAAMRRRHRHALTVLSARARPRSLTPPFPPFLRLVLAQTAAAVAAPARAGSSATALASPELAHPATPARRRPLHLAQSSASTSYTPCSSR